MSSNEFSEIEYHGQAGITQKCLKAIARLLQFGDRISDAKLLTSHSTHCFLLTVNEFSQVAIRSGFRSGYPGEGPRGLSSALLLLDQHGADIEEYEVDENIIKRLDGACLRENDLNALETLHPVRPIRWYDYLREPDQDARAKIFLKQFPLVIPFKLLDHRLIDLALDFDENIEHAVFTAYKRLESTVRKNAQLPGESGKKLFSLAFQGENSKLHWEGIEAAEQTGRANLFTGAYMAFRNRRAHHEEKIGHEESLREFLLINMLFKLEAESCERPASNKEEQ